MTLPSKERQYVFQKGRKKGPSAVSRHPHEIHHNDDEHDGRLAGLFQPCADAVQCIGPLRLSELALDCNSA